MKKTIAALFAVAATAAFAGANDLLIMFSTPGVDKYADGTTVLDGESYALVWTAPDGAQTTVLSVPRAKDGKCSPFLFIVDENDAPKYKDGTWAVYLLDSRDFAKDPTGKTLAELDEKGVPTVVNVKAALADGITKSTGFASALPAEGVTPGAYDLAGANVPNPVVTGIKIVGANVIVTVKNTVPFVGYTLQAGDSVSTFAVPAGAQSRTGDASGEIDLITPKKDGAQFFKVSTIQ
jgi:hypothetical protein